MHISDEQLLYDLFQAYHDARKHKRNTNSQLRFELNLEKNLYDLYEGIRQRRYFPGHSMCFIQEKPVKREIFASPFRDRVVHHLLFNYIEPHFERLFIFDSYSCRKGKGTLRAEWRLDHHIRCCSRNYSRLCYVLQLDIKGYFMNIDKQVLYKLIRDRVERWRDRLDVELCDYLIRCVLFRDPTEGAVIMGKRSDWEGLPASKSLFHRHGITGLPIGDLTSQLFSNIFLNELDQFCKRTLHCHYYGRYVDDFYIVDRDAARLKAMVPRISDFLVSHLHAQLHPDKIRLTPSDHGVAFMSGYHVPPLITSAVHLPAGIIPGRRLWHNYLHELHGQHRPASLSSYHGFMGHYLLISRAARVVGMLFKRITENGR
ncbi:MAG: RNA-directed DNA polymerase [Prevotella sp.]|nr:RNA-directed DNA polymerase [Prevotella sp.]